jgi:hypothetical protein
LYQPERFGVKGHILRRGGPASDRLHLDLTIGRVPSEFNVATYGLTVSVRDDDVVYSATISVGAMIEKFLGRV